jgi:hypothetical protein
LALEPLKAGGDFRQGAGEGAAIVSAAGPVVRLHAVSPRLGPEAIWNGEIDVVIRSLLPDGTVVATAEDGEVVVLQLYRGEDRSSLLALIQGREVAPDVSAC